MSIVTGVGNTVAVEFSVRPWAYVDADADDARFDDLLDRLLADSRALGVGGIVTVEGIVSSSFQVEEEDLEGATRLARAILDDALTGAGLRARTTGVSVVEGDDPDLLCRP